MAFTKPAKSLYLFAIIIILCHIWFKEQDSLVFTGGVSMGPLLRYRLQVPSFPRRHKFYSREIQLFRSPRICCCFKGQTKILKIILRNAAELKVLNHIQIWVLSIYKGPIVEVCLWSHRSVVNFCRRKGISPSQIFIIVHLVMNLHPIGKLSKTQLNSLYGISLLQPTEALPYFVKLS